MNSQYVSNFKIRALIFLGLLLINFIVVNAQNSQSFTLNWQKPIDYGLEGGEQYKTLSFEEAQYDFSVNTLPYFVTQIFEKQSNVLQNVRIENPRFEPLSDAELAIIQRESVPDQIELEFFTSTFKKRKNGYVKLSPIRRNGRGEIEKLVSFDLEYDLRPAAVQRRKKAMTFASQSKMRSGDWYKIGVTKDAMFKLDYDFLNNLGINLDEIDPRKFRLFGYGGGMLPELNSEKRPDDLVENNIKVVGEADGRFDRGDYIVFYGEGQVEWRYDSSKQVFRHQVNRFSDTTYYFLSPNLSLSNPPKRVGKESPINASPSYTTNSFDAYDYHENNSKSLIKSGRVWVGEEFDDGKLSRTFGFNIPNTIQGTKAKIELSAFARSSAQSNFILSLNGKQFSLEIPTVNVNRYWDTFARSNTGFFEFTSSGNPINVNLRYNKTRSVSKGWLNSLSLNVRSFLNFQSGSLFFRDVQSVGNDYSEFLIQSNKPIEVWDITNKYNAVEKNIQKTGVTNRIISPSKQLREFVAFNELNQADVHGIGRVHNQNLHGLPQADLIIISHPKFMSQANRLASFHRNEGLKVNVVNPQQIYNEFSSGSQDLVAIRSFLKMFYDRASSEKDMPKYVTIYGDASYDYKNRITNNTNFVPSFQARNSMDPVNSYVSDHYFGFLDDDEGEWLPNAPNAEIADIAVGRLTVKSEEEAEAVLQKIFHYAKPTTLNDWRNTIVFVADDEDGVIHMSQSNDLSQIVDQKGSDFLPKKIFLDAYQQVSTAGGQRYPGANKDLNQSVQRGGLFVNYTGHGGETGWTGERVLAIADITSWNNLDNLPVFITATCEFTRFDDPQRTSAGELTLLNPEGGSIALMTTTRLVFSSPNYLMNRVFYDKVFKRKADGTVKRLGDIFLEVKNISANSLNSRNFSLLGDAALKMAIPEYEVVTTHINGKPISELDTLRALSTVTVSGYVSDIQGNKLNNFNGTVMPTIFDKETKKKTLNNDGGGVFSYKERDRRLFKGKASVVNGEFEFSFVVPKDISYSFGNGKIHYYTENGLLDGNGSTEQLIIGGSNDSLVADDQGPEMDVFMNDKSFVQGGITSDNPVLLVDLFDDLGINTVGGGIGHDLVAIIDGNTEKAIILNDFYEAEEDNFKRGKIRYPMKDLSEGNHNITVKAWDVANNSSEKSIDFTVLEEKEIEIQNVLNYPNPFTTNTEFIFQHNQAGIPLDIKLEVFTVSGKLVKSFNQTIVNDGFISRDIRWDGRDEYGDKIGKGVYIYKIKVRSQNGSTAEKFEKLVIL